MSLKSHALSGSRCKLSDLWFWIMLVAVLLMFILLAFSRVESWWLWRRNHELKEEVRQLENERREAMREALNLSAQINQIMLEPHVSTPAPLPGYPRIYEGGE